MTKKIPLLLNIVTIIGMILAILEILAGGLLLLLGAAFNAVSYADELGMFAGIITVGGGLLLIAAGVLSLIFIIFLRKGANWARWLWIVMLGLGAVFNLISIKSLGGLLMPAISIGFMLYLILDKDVKKFF